MKWVTLATVETKAWTRYLAAVTHPDNDRTIAEKVGISPSTISRWTNGSIDPKPRQVVALARAYDQNPLSALLAAGYLDESDLGEHLTITVAPELEGVSTDRLVDELQTRLEAIDEYLSWLEQIGGGRTSAAGLSADVLRYIRPSVAPTDAEGQVYIDALGQSLESTDALGVQVFRPIVNVGGVAEDELSMDEENDGSVHHVDFTKTSNDDHQAAASAYSDDRGEDDYDA